MMIQPALAPRSTCPTPRASRRCADGPAAQPGAVGAHLAELVLVAAGASLAELLVVVALIGIVTAASVPMFHTYVHGSAVKAGAEELVTVMNLARALAIKENTRVCVNWDSAGSHRVRLLVAHANPCAAAANFYGAQGRGFDARIDASGWITLQNRVTVTAATADVVFTALGVAAPGGTYTVSRNGQHLSVVVAPSGRVNITP
jgi:Tfp pilus assembly protein FimT